MSLLETAVPGHQRTACSAAAVLRCAVHARALEALTSARAPTYSELADSAITAVDTALMLPAGSSGNGQSKPDFASLPTSLLPAALLLYVRRGDAVVTRELLEQHPTCLDAVPQVSAPPCAWHSANMVWAMACINIGQCSTRCCRKSAHS